MFKRIDHLVVAVEDVEEAAALYTDVYGLEASELHDLSHLGLKAINIELGNAYIELAQPTSPDGPVGKFLAEKGDGLYLIAIQVDDLPGTIEKLKAQGARILGGPPGQTFIHPKSTHGALIMLIE